MTKKPKTKKEQLSTNDMLELILNAVRGKTEPGPDVLAELNKKVEALVKKLEDLTKRLEKIEKKSDDNDFLDLFKKIQKEQEDKKPSSPWPPEPPFGRKPRPWRPAPYPKPRRTPDIDPDNPWKDIDPHDDWTKPYKLENKCKVCGIEWGNGSWGYVCNRTDCPSRITFTDSAPPILCQTKGGSFLDIVGQNGTKAETCACGQNSTCQCCK